MKNKPIDKSLDINQQQQKEEALTKEDFFKALDKTILTVKKPKSPAKGKKKASG